MEFYINMLLSFVSDPVKQFVIYKEYLPSIYPFFHKAEE